MALHLFEWDVQYSILYTLWLNKEVVVVGVEPYFTLSSSTATTYNA